MMPVFLVTTTAFAGTESQPSQPYKSEPKFPEV